MIEFNYFTLLSTHITVFNMPRCNKINICLSLNKHHHDKINILNFPFPHIFNEIQRTKVFLIIMNH